MPTTTLCLTDCEVGIEYSIEDGRAIFDSAYTLDRNNLGELDCEHLFIVLENEKPINLITYFQRKLDEKSAYHPELLVA